MTATKSIPELPRADRVNNNDKIVLNQAGIDKNLTVDRLLEDINNGTPFRLVMKTEATNTRLLTLADEQAYITCTSPGQTAIVLTSQSDTPWREGTVIYFRRQGGNVQFSAAPGVQINPSSSGYSLTEYGQVGALVRNRENVWDIVTGGNGSVETSELTTDSTNLSYILGAGNNNQWMDIFGTPSGMTIQCPPESDIDLGSRFVHMITNYSSSVITIEGGTGVTVIPPNGGSLNIPQNATVGIKKANYDQNTYIVFGATEAS